MNEIDEGRKAELLLNNDVFEAAVSEVRDGIIKAWECSQSADKDGREELYRELHGLRAVLRRLIAKKDAATIKGME